MNGAPNGGAPQGTNQMNRQQRRQQLDTYYQNQIQPTLPEYAQAAYADRPRLRRQATRSYMAQGRLPLGVARLSSIRQANPDYSQASTATQQQYLSDLQTPLDTQRAGVDYQVGGNQTISQLSNYVQQRLGTGLTPAEEALYRGRGMEATEAAAAGARRTAANQAVASGLDPRAQMATSNILERQRQQQRADVERQVTEEDLKRKAEIEDLATKTGALREEERQFDVGTAEGARRFDVGAGLQRQQLLASEGLGLGGQEENRYQYDTGFVEGRRQARANRELLRHLARAAAPSGLERAGAILGGIRGGLSPNG